MTFYEVLDFAEEENSVAYDTHYFFSLEEAKKALDTWADHRPSGVLCTIEVDSVQEIESHTNAGRVFVHMAQAND